MAMNEDQKSRLQFVDRMHAVQEKYKKATHGRVKELVQLRHALQKEILLLRDQIATKRNEERKVLLKAKRTETTLY